MDLKDFTNAISNFGFPIVVAMYLLLRIEKKLENFTATVGEKLDNLSDKIDDLSTNIKIMSSKQCR